MTDAIPGTGDHVKFRVEVGEHNPHLMIPSGSAQLNICAFLKSLFERFVESGWYLEYSLLVAV